MVGKLSLYREVESGINNTLDYHMEQRMKKFDELMAQPTLDSGEARRLAKLLGHSVSPRLYTRWCREAKARGLVAENRNGRWYVNRKSWTEYLATPRPTGWQGHRDVKAGEPAKE